MKRPEGPRVAMLLRPRTLAALARAAALMQAAGDEADLIACIESLRTGFAVALAAAGHPVDVPAAQEPEAALSA